MSYVDDTIVRARRIIESANFRMSLWGRYTDHFGTTERSAPSVHALVGAVAEELIELEERMRVTHLADYAKLNDRILALEMRVDGMGSV